MGLTLQKTVSRILVRITTLKFRTWIRQQNLMIRPVRLAITPSLFLTNVSRWRKSGLNESLWRINTYSDSPVVDIGSHKGDFLEKRLMLEPTKQYFGYEPILEFFESSAAKFKPFPNVVLRNFGLSNKNEFATFRQNGDATGVMQVEGVGMKVQLRDIAKEEIFSRSLSLVVCNIEGGEYNLVDRLVEKNMIKNIEVLLIQTHDVDDFSKQKMIEMRRQLSKTHFPEFKYDFIWDSWIRKNLERPT
jgi:hypothetical protein